jgi:hypothetical protein
VERTAVPGAWVSPIILLQQSNVGSAVQQAVCQCDREHCVVGETAEGVKKAEIGPLDGACLIDRADDVPGDGSEHGKIPVSVGGCI